MGKLRFLNTKVPETLAVSSSSKFVKSVRNRSTGRFNCSNGGGSLITSTTFLIVLTCLLSTFFNGVDSKRSACWRYGHSCWGGHGKRSGGAIPENIPRIGNIGNPDVFGLFDKSNGKFLPFPVLSSLLNEQNHNKDPRLPISNLPLTHFLHKDPGIVGLGRDIPNSNSGIMPMPVGVQRSSRFVAGAAPQGIMLKHLAKRNLAPDFYDDDSGGSDSRIVQDYDGERSYGKDGSKEGSQSDEKESTSGQDNSVFTLLQQFV